MSGAEELRSRDELRRKAGKTFSANLKRIREASGLSQENLSLRATLVRSHVGKLEKEGQIPEIDTIYRLAGALGVEPRELIAEFYWRPDETGGDGYVTAEPPKKPYKV